MLGIRLVALPSRQAVCRYMRMFRVVGCLLLGLFGAAPVFLVFFRVHSRGDLPQPLGESGGRKLGQEAPVPGLGQHQQGQERRRYFMAHIVGRDRLGNWLLMGAVQGGQGDLEDVVSHQRQAEAEQGRPRIGQGVDLRFEMLFDVLKRRFERPSFPVERGQRDCIDRLRQVGDQTDVPPAIRRNSAIGI